MRSMQAKQRQIGFTLIEIMLVVAIMAIVASIAFSSFSDTSKDSTRVRAIADISSLNDAVERYYQSSFSYTGADADIGALARAAGITLIPDYTFSLVVAADGQSYVLVAAPAVGTAMVGDGALVMDQSGARCYFQGNDAAAAIAAGCQSF